MPKSRSRRKPPPRPRSARPPKEPLVQQPAPGLRGEVERFSAPVLLWLSSRPRFFVPVLSAVLLIGGLAAPAGFGVPLLLLLVALVGWLSYLSWPVVTGVQRLLRLGTIGLVLAAVAGKFSG
jgi:hypothetical protein